MSLLIKLKLYLKQVRARACMHACMRACVFWLVHACMFAQFRKRRSDANALWVAIAADFSDQQQKILEMDAKLQENKIVRLSSCELRLVCIKYII